MRFFTVLVFAVLVLGLGASPCAAQTVPPSAATLLPTEPRKPGLYYSWEEFCANNPGEPGMPDVETQPHPGTEWAGDNELKPYHRNSAGKRVLATAIWGFSDGQTAYIHYGQGFYQLRPHENDFVFFGRAGTGPVLHSAINLLALASVASGGGAMLSNNPEHRVLYRLYTTTGMVSLSPTLGTSVATGAERPTQVFVYRPRNAKGPAARIRLGAGEPAQELAAGDYLSFSPPIGVPVTICLVPAAGPEILLPLRPFNNSAIYLECRPQESTPLHEMPVAAGEAALTRLVK